VQKLVNGIHHYQTEVFAGQREMFRRLSQGQHPLALFVTCSDSRINPAMITQTEPGELFIARNAGNIVPPHGTQGSGEAATIEYAIAGLGVEHVIVCGHSHCGAMKAVLEPDSVRGMPSVACWLQHAEATGRIIRENYGHLQGDRLLTAAVQENVLVQLDHLRTHPSVAARLAGGRLKLHGWVYKMETGEVFTYDPVTGQFVPLVDESSGREVAVSIGAAAAAGGTGSGRAAVHDRWGRVARRTETDLHA
jgi:carbonic anhydrase